MDKPVALIKDLLGDYADRRRDLRYPCQLDGAIANDEGQAMACKIVSLSCGGLSAKCAERLEKGELVDVRGPADSQPLKFRVEWVSSDLVASLSLADPTEALDGSWLAAELERLGARARSRQRRGVVRVKCCLPALLSWPGVERQATIVDLGTTGARLECRGEPLPQDLLVAFGPREHLPRIAVWAALIGAHDAEAAQYGVAFTNFESGSPRELLDYVNHVFTPKRA
jgi:hypothetical protein